MMNSIIQWMFSILLIVNLYLIGNKSIWGPVTGVGINCAFILYYTFMSHQYGLLLGTVILIAFNLRVWVKWSKDMKAGL